MRQMRRIALTESATGRSVRQRVQLFCGGPGPRPADSLGGAPAQPRDHMLDVWDTDRGLPSSSVTSLAQTPEGYLWAGTANGLLRFDGLRFVTFDPETTPALLNARVEHLFVDPQGTLWINTYDGSITSWRAGVFRHEWKGAGPLSFEAFLAPSGADETVFVLDTGAVIRRPLAVDGSHRGRSCGRPPEGKRSRAAVRPRWSGSLWTRSADHRVWRHPRRQPSRKCPREASPAQP